MTSTQDVAAAEVAVTETSPLLTRDGTPALNTDDAFNGGHVEGGGAVTPVLAAQEGNPEMLRKMHILLPAVGIGIFLAAVDQLLTIAIYANIGNELNALNSTSWIATAYFLTLTSFQPLYGKLSDIFGRKECLLFAYTVFGMGCLGCGLARDMTQLCIARAVSGIGGGGITSVVSILLSDIVPLQDRGIYQAHVSVIYSAGSSLGGPLGGILADSVGWRWAFIGQVPLCVLAFVAVFVVLEMPAPTTEGENWLAKLRRVDFLGAFALIIAVTDLILGLDFGAQKGWSHLATIVPLALFPVLAAAFIFVEMRLASEPFAPGHVIFPRAMLACYAGNFFGVSGYVGLLFVIPLYFQAVLRKTATESGLLLVAPMVASVVGAVIVGIVMKRTGRYYRATLFSFGIALLAMVGMTISIWKDNLAGQDIALTICLGGYGSGITSTLIALLANAAVEDSAVVIASSYLFRSLGSSMGVGISTVVLQQVLRDQLASRLPADVAADIQDKVRHNLEYIEELPAALAAEVRASYHEATLGACGPVLGFMFVAFLATFWIREKSLKR